MQILVDYLTMSTKIHSLDEIMEMLGLTNIEMKPIRSFLGYQNCLYYDGVRIHWTDNDVLSEICIDLSGTGCRTIEHIHELKWDWLSFLKYFEDDFKSKEVHISRIDIAGDEFDGSLNIDTLEKYTRERKYISKAKSEPWGTWGRKREIYHGSEKSDRIMRIYDKALQMGYPEGIAHWIRVEMQFRNDNALSFLLNWFKVKSIGECYAGVLNDFLRYTTKSPLDLSNNHNEKLNTARFWRNFIGSSMKLKQCYLQGREYNIENVDNYISRQASSSLKTLLLANKGDLSRIIEIIETATINTKQEELLRKVNIPIKDYEISKPKITKEEFEKIRRDIFGD